MRSRDNYMNIFSSIQEAKNCVSINGSPSIFQGSKIFVGGHGNSIVFEDGVKVQNCTIKFHSDNSVLYVGSKSKLTGNVLIGLQSEVLIGSSLTITGGLKISCAEFSKLEIGNDCMFGVGVEIATHDFHPIFDIETGVRLNKSKNVLIEDSVWLANGACILKGAVVRKGTVVGARSVFSGVSDDHSVYVGNPAVKVRSNVRWSRVSLNTTYPYYFDSLEDLKKI